MPTLIEIIIILVAAFLSFKTTKSDVRTKNHFTWGAIEEVAVLFIGIFITMQPALMILKSKGAELGLTKPLEMFWATGALSSFPGQYTNLSGIPYNGRNTGRNQWYCHNRGNRCGQDAYGNLLWCGIYGSQHIHRKCSELYGEIHFG